MGGVRVLAGLEAAAVSQDLPFAIGRYQVAHRAGNSQLFLIAGKRGLLECVTLRCDRKQHMTETPPFSPEPIQDPFRFMGDRPRSFRPSVSLLQALAQE
jgi:hypothetical protein